MPRKNRGMWYEVHPTPVKGEDGKNLVYVRPKSGLKLTMKELEGYCERNYALRYGDNPQTAENTTWKRTYLYGDLGLPYFLGHHPEVRLNWAIGAQWFAYSRTVVWV